MHFKNFAVAITLVGVLAGCSDTPPSGDPKKRLNAEMRGWEAPVGVLMGADETPYWVQSAVANFRPAENSDRPAKIEKMPANDCGFPKPGKDELLAKVHVDGSKMPSPVFGFSHADVGERTKDFISAYTHKKGDAKPRHKLKSDQLDIVDVVVTETTKPVYLVLTYSFPTIFNIQLAEGARLARVALVGHDMVGLANVDATVPVSALTGSRMKSCGVTPVRKPADHWNFVRDAKNDPNNSALSEGLAKNMSMFYAFSGWYRSTFGDDSEPGAIGASIASHVLVGPLPETLEERVPYKSMEGSRLLLTHNDYVFVATEDEYREKHGEIILKAASELAGGDLKNLLAGH
jgi:hypothetical protein